MSSWTGRLNTIKMSPLSQINRFNFYKTDVTIRVKEQGGKDLLY